MSRKRRYYREERRRPVYLDEDDDYEDDEEEPEDLERTVSKMSWGMLAVLSFGVLLSIAHSLYTPSAPISNDGYRVVSVSRGQLHAEEVGTGKRVSFDDQKLVKAALEGAIKRGDVFHR